MFDALTRECIGEIVHKAGGGLFDERLDAIADAVWREIEVDGLAHEIGAAVRQAVLEVSGMLGIREGIEESMGDLIADDWQEYRRIARHIIAVRDSE